MRRRFGVMIRLDLDDDAADAVNQQGGPDQVGRDLAHAAGKERTLERPAQLGCGLIRGDGVLSHSNRQDANRQDEKCVADATRQPLC